MADFGTLTTNFIWC